MTSTVIPMYSSISSNLGDRPRIQTEEETSQAGFNGNFGSVFVGDPERIF